MKKINFYGLLMLLFLLVSCGNRKVQEPTQPLVSGGDVEVYYFHMTTRCVTCKAVEAEARKNLEMLYPALYNEGKISFVSLNLEEQTGKAMGDRLGVAGQTLLIVKGDTKINITNEGFLYAVSNPDKFKEVIKEKVDPLIK
jgi:hypothetical protein